MGSAVQKQQAAGPTNVAEALRQMPPNDLKDAMAYVMVPRLGKHKKDFGMKKTAAEIAPWLTGIHREAIL